MRQPACPNCVFFKREPSKHYEGFCTKDAEHGVQIPIFRDFFQKACRNFQSPEGVTYQDAVRHKYDLIILARLSRIGIPDCEVARRVGVSMDVVRSHRLRLGIKRHTSNLGKIRDWKLKELYEKGLTYREIAKHFGCGILTVQQRLSKLGLSGLRRKKLMAEILARKVMEKGRVLEFFKLKKGVATSGEVHMAGLSVALKKLVHENAIGSIQLSRGRGSSRRYMSSERFGQYAGRRVYYTSPESLGQWLADNVDPLPGTVRIFKDLLVPEEAISVYRTRVKEIPLLPKEG